MDARATYLMGLRPTQGFRDYPAKRTEGKCPQTRIDVDQMSTFSKLFGSGINIIS